jgi:hypothetical protein
LPASYAKEHAKFLTTARDALDEATFEEAWTCGTKLSLELAIDEVLELSQVAA